MTEHEILRCIEDDDYARLSAKDFIEISKYIELKLTKMKLFLLQKDSK